MTPKREKYLAKCSKREKWFRMQIEDLKKDIKGVKRALTLGYVDDWNITWLRKCKFFLTIYRHELARLKGMDRVVVPKRGCFCKCGRDLYGAKMLGSKYCDECGRKLLWEKVK